ncbi:hypothetical protein ONE63_000168 [Megalurothrips usitatus]|uniref:G-protein coupled receptors family 1 profile domain-containing protein n=1 Tax=Megalurothrips usitatus TaxID=439358 RepID=A0AAV7Y1G2_9NEOP|nr:hypothetical protein ONE63_000168 [Megalurothrips usitatus]
MGAYAVVEYTLMALMVVCNLFILVAYAVGRVSRGYNNTLRLPSSGRLVLNLVLADLLVGVGLCYFSIFKFWPDMAAYLAKYQVPCVLRFAICFLSMNGSHCALLVVALDRYIAIVHTLYYKDFMTTRVSWCLILVGWCTPLCGSAALFFVNEWRPDVPVCDEHHIVPQFLIWFALPSNVFVLLAISVAHWRVHQEVKAFTRRCADPDFVASSASRRSYGCRKSAQVLLRMTTTFIVCWTPLDLMLVTMVVVGPKLWLLVLFEATFLLGMTSFLLNPFMYVWQTEAIRRPLAAALVSLSLLRPAVLAARGPRGPRGPSSLPRADARSRGVFAITRASVLSVSHSSSSSAHTTQSSVPP